MNETLKKVASAGAFVILTVVVIGIVIAMFSSKCGPEAPDITDTREFNIRVENMGYVEDGHTFQIPYPYGLNIAGGRCYTMQDRESLTVKSLNGEEVYITVVTIDGNTVIMKSATIEGTRPEPPAPQPDPQPIPKPDPVIPEPVTPEPVVPDPVDPYEAFVGRAQAMIKKDLPKDLWPKCAEIGKNYETVRNLKLKDEDEILSELVKLNRETLGFNKPSENPEAEAAWQKLLGSHGSLDVLLSAEFPDGIADWDGVLGALARAFSNINE